MWNVFTRQNLQIEVDYEVVNFDIWRFFNSKYYRYTEIRRSVRDNGTKDRTVVVNLLRVTPFGSPLFKKFKAVLFTCSMISNIVNEYSK